MSRYHSTGDGPRFSSRPNGARWGGGCWRCCSSGWCWSLLWLEALEALEEEAPASHPGSGWGKRSGGWFCATAPTGSRWGGASLVVLAALLDPPRLALGAVPALITLAWCGLLVALLRPVLAALARCLSLPIAPRTMNWLLLLIVAAFGLRYGGRIYPQSMPGDILFHTHRFVEAIGQGHILLKAPHRGATFPYPPGAYLVAAPLALLIPEPPRFFEFGAALVDGLSAALVAAIVVAVGASGCSQDRSQYRSRNRPQTTALLAAAIYVFAPAGLMATWWSFDTHIWTQFVALLLVAALVVLLAPAGQWRWWPGSGVVALFTSLVLLGHSGFFVNTVLLGGWLLPALWLAAWRGVAWARSACWPLTLTFGATLLGTFLCFSSAYLPMMMEQAHTVVTEGLPEMTRQAPVPHEVLWHTLWHDGVVRHFGGFPLLLVPSGWWALLEGRGHQSPGTRSRPVRRSPARAGVGALVLAALMVGTLLVSGFLRCSPL
ncbi:MAG: hypothetical protein HC884_00210 [Chloroflexaceae bacterium]|nr:hypothetical protein [Chloroflexaceae bacterium]